jgi:hypothetical protein
MAHFAEIDKNNKVLRVLVVDNLQIISKSGEEDENLGILRWEDDNQLMISTSGGILTLLYKRLLLSRVISVFLPLNPPSVFAAYTSNVKQVK